MIELKKWIIDYAEDIAKHANNEKISKNLMDIFPHPYTLYDAKGYIEYCMSLDENTHLYRAIVVDGKAVGSISITLGTDIHSKTCEIGYWLGEDYWNKGIMKKAIKQICAMAFEELEIVRIYAEVFDYNTASCKVLEKCGFTFEGKLRNVIYKNDKIYDGLMYARISDEDK